MKETPRRKFIGLFTQPFYQIRLGFYVMGMSFLFVFSLFFVFLYSFYEQYEQVMTVFNVIDWHSRFVFISNNIFFLGLSRIMFTVFSFMIIMFFLVLKLTHRYYGPLTAIKIFAERIEKREFQARVVLRKNDELQDLAKALNRMAEGLEKFH